MLDWGTMTREHTALGMAAVVLFACGGGSSGDAGTCDPAECAASCAEAGYGSATCVDGLCQCTGRLDAGGDTDAAEDAGTEDVTVEDEGADEAEAVAEAEAGPCDGIDVAAVSGAYAGTFAGTIHAMGTDYPMEGSVEFTMTESAPGEWTFDGAMAGTAMGGVYEWTSGVQGDADCAGLAGLFYDGMVSVEGTDYHFGGTMESGFVPYSFPDGTFEGTCTDCPVPVTGDGTWDTSHL
jgi:hypothetical protein